ncbi:MAG: S-formylglutathione hydrolase [Zoogloea sp.]|jgi:S-formylglutathione hydrolase|uniref:S-formylglutathione hydrolase n=1 Tax=Zoogloea sp. TaxID=49181 RepID=UPI001B736DCC|nr:S-formylglutathione hydrolase [Zoogloea sp.]MBP8267241.1 S-formylglutathione hydrolase [Zoogloea sp.]HQA12425.1 S-formylglutathione hydrolase [Zoogloea sp.]HQE37759.1 S-formylglutathione hydrolase [Zoogloea sp.]
MPFETLSRHACFGGSQGFYRHQSREIGLPMRFSVFTPPQAAEGPVPVLFYLAGLTCTEETFAIKAGAQRVAAELGLMLVAPDTSPRDAQVPGEADTWDFGVGAGFYLDAVREPWARHWRMESYITGELRQLIGLRFPADLARCGIFGHSMGGHGALTLALRHPGLYRSVSAFAPIAAPSLCPWGQKAFGGYLGDNRDLWRKHDAATLIEDGLRCPPILIDQGLEDQFLPTQLNPDRFEQVCADGQPLTLRRHPGYDHGYYFISTFIADHLAHHAQYLRA